MLYTKNVLVTTAALVVHCLMCIGGNEVSSATVSQSESYSSNKELKNSEHLNVIEVVPNVSSLVTTLGDSQKYECLNGLMTVWTSVLHDDGHMQVTNGESVYFLCIAYLLRVNWFLIAK